MHAETNHCTVLSPQQHPHLQPHLSFLENKHTKKAIPVDLDWMTWQVLAGSLMLPVSLKINCLNIITL